MYLLEKPASLSGWELRADAAGMKLVLVQPEQKVTYELFLSADHKSLTKWTVLQTDIPDEGEWLNEFTYDAYVDIEGVSIPVKGRRASFVGSNRAHYSTVEYDGTGTILRTVPTFSTIGPELFPNGAHFIDTIKDKEYTVGKPLTSPLNRAGDTASRQPAAKTSAELLSTRGRTTIIGATTKELRNVDLCRDWHRDPGCGCRRQKAAGIRRSALPFSIEEPGMRPTSHRRTTRLATGGVMQKLAGFTIVEVLVVIGLITLLMGCVCQPFKSLVRPHDGLSVKRIFISLASPCSITRVAVNRCR